jgi:hypothetical protein
MTHIALIIHHLCFFGFIGISVRQFDWVWNKKQCLLILWMWALTSTAAILDLLYWAISILQLRRQSQVGVFICSYDILFHKLILPFFWERYHSSLFSILVSRDIGNGCKIKKYYKSWNVCNATHTKKSRDLEIFSLKVEM